MYLVKTPFWLRWIYPNLTWRKPDKEKCLYLTFDDGPIPVVTPFVLETLKKFGAHATFFCIGDNVIKHNEIYQSIIKAGHSIGNHTFNHLKGWATEDDRYIDNIIMCATLVRSNLFRPPYGRIKYSQIQSLRTRFPDLQIIMWDTLSGDFDINLTPEKCLANVLKNARAGSIVVFHDSLKAFQRLEFTLPRALEHWKKCGYTFKTL